MSAPTAAHAGAREAALVGRKARKARQLQRSGPEKRANSSHQVLQLNQRKGNRRAQLRINQTGLKEKQTSFS